MNADWISDTVPGISPAQRPPTMQGTSILQRTNLGSLPEVKQLAKADSELTPAKSESPHSFHFAYLNSQDFQGRFNQTFSASVSLNYKYYKILVI